MNCRSALACLSSVWIAGGLTACVTTAVVDVDHPSGDPNLTASATVEVRASPAEVWRYVSDSSKAVAWSVYFHHISLASGTDGEVGAVRHCYRAEDERGIRWSEEVLSVVPERLRAMRVFDLHGMAVTEMDRSELVVWQILEPTDHGTTRLTFRTTLQNDEPRSHQVLWFMGRASVQDVFEDNLENIARAIEEGDAFSRRHAYRRLAGWELARGADADARQSSSKDSS